MITPHVQCCCRDCVTARRAFVLRTHPLLRAKAEEPGPSLIPADQALAMRLEDEEELEEMLANTRAEIKILRDCAGGKRMTAKCGTCYWNVTIPSCAYSYTALYGENCDEWGPAKEYERGRPRGGRGGLGPTKNLLFFFFHYYHHDKETCLS